MKQPAEVSASSLQLPQAVVGPHFFTAADHGDPAGTHLGGCSAPKMNNDNHGGPEPGTKCLLAVAPQSLQCHLLAKGHIPPAGKGEMSPESPTVPQRRMKDRLEAAR